MIHCLGKLNRIRHLGEPHSLDLWDFAIAVNLTGSFNLTRLALKHLVKVNSEDGPDGERGVVIFVASAAAVSVISEIQGQSSIHDRHTRRQIERL